MIPTEEELVEAQITWDIGKMLGLQVSNENAVIAALSKMHEVQDCLTLKERPSKKEN